MWHECFRRSRGPSTYKKYGPWVWQRDFFDAKIIECPDDTALGKTFGLVGLDRGGLRPVDAFLDLVVEHGAKVRRVQDADRAHRPFMTIEHAVHLLTGELADWYGLDAGHLRVGGRADAVVIDPDRLDATLDSYAEHPASQYDNLSRMVDRNDAAVAAVFVGGKYGFGAGEPGPALGTERSGRFLRAG